MRIGILTISDLGAQGRRADTSGDAILSWSAANSYEVVVRSTVPDEAGQVAIWLDQAVVDRLAAMRRPGESYSDVIVRLVEIEARRRA